MARITATLAGAYQRTLLNKIGKIARCSGETGIGDRPVIPGTQPALESVRPFPEHPKQSLFLPLVDLVAQAIQQLGLVDQEANTGNRPRLRLDDNIGKPCQPGINIVALAAELKRGVIGFGPSDQGSKWTLRGVDMGDGQIPSGIPTASMTMPFDCHFA